MSEKKLTAFIVYWNTWNKTQPHAGWQFQKAFVSRFEAIQYASTHAPESNEGLVRSKITQATIKFPTKKEILSMLEVMPLRLIGKERDIFIN